ncbi:MAG: CPBP family intramembrane metalloprotease [Chloroflexi bacterium]|nr:CPBP family intramembrane metalloprotease [Chloroflexota bacterium]MCI0834715.1 CPBP family intramembrane metalloprotease [Chloroflexota bacterium]MCI0835990.1 CPBP family intramembrane metalloprotease [Chloroflexota bacterium]
MIQPQRQPEPGQHRNDSRLPEVKWGPLDVVVGAAVTMLVVISILSFGGVVGTYAGFETSVASPAGYIVGALSAALAILLIRITRSPLWPVVLALAFGVGVVSASYLIATDAGDGIAELVGIPVSIIAVTVMSGSFAVIGLALSAVRYREPLSALGFVKTSGFRPYLFAAGMWLIGLSALIAWVQVVIWLDIDLLLPRDTANDVLDQAGGSIVLTILLVAIAGPVAEEIFFRGFVLTGLLKRFGVGRALLLSSLLFGLFHIDPGAIVPTFALGLALGWVYLKTGSIWPAIFAHALHNTVAVLIAKYGTAA